MKTSLHALAVAGVLALWSAPVPANDQAAFDAERILAQQQQIRSEAEARSGRYKTLSDAKRADLFARQDRVSALLSGVENTNELKEAQRVELFNALEAIEGIVNAAEDERMICERSKPVGSNRPRTVCKTVAQRRAERESVEGDLRRRNLECSEAMMGPGGCARN